MILAQAIDSLPASFWKYFCMALAAVIVLGCGVVVAYASVRKPDSTRINDEPAVKVEKISKRYNHDAIDQRFGRIETRIDGHDSELDAAWKEMQRMNAENNKTNLEVAVSLARLETHFGLNRSEKKQS